MKLVITSCTNRKRKPVSDGLRMAALPPAEVRVLVSQWVRRLAAEPTRFRGDEIYGGRGFKEAVDAAASLNARLLVVSAGLGLIDVSTAVPPYACTVLGGAIDSVRSRVTDDLSVGGWWRALSELSPFAVDLRDAAGASDGLICVALSETYIEMIESDLIGLPAQILSRTRIFTRAPLNGVSEALHPFVMPYDDRLDGPDSPNRGTRSDFAGRALRHFVELTISDPPGRSVAEHSAAVAAALRGWRMPARTQRTRCDDVELINLIRTHWDAERGSSSRLLRRFRDNLGIACEQSRFAELARAVRSERT